jgi:LytS/YehU family sensor histidine kinase
MQGKREIEDVTEAIGIAFVAGLLMGFFVGLGVSVVVGLARAGVFEVAQ